MDLIRADEALTLSGVVLKDGRHIQEEDLGLIKKPILLKDKNKILFIGVEKHFNTFFKNNKDLFLKKRSKEINHVGTLMPGFVECHTHLVFAGDRKHEFEMRNRGKTYQQIAEAGGGIQFTMAQTKKSSKKELLSLAQARVDEFKKQGVVLVESKTGYGSDLKTELKILEVNNELKGVEIFSTFLGLHAIQGTKEKYVQDVVLKYIPQIHKKTKVRHADIFMDQGYFDEEDLNLLVREISKLGWTFTAHTDQLAGTGAGLKASVAGALSISHCVNMTEDEIKKVASSRTVFNLLPAADFYLKIAYPKARQMIEAGGKVSLATDFNPGSSPTQNVNFTGVLARLEMKMTLPEVIASYTYNAASSLGKAVTLKQDHLSSGYGALVPGASSHIQMISKNWTDLFYQI